jgi:hypothetical protein
VSSDQSNWDILLPQCAFALNNSVHASTSVSPFACLYGFNANLPVDHALSHLQDVTVKSVDDLVSARLRIHNQVKSNLAAASAAMLRYTNRKRRDIQFKQGDLVWVKTDHLNLPSGLSRKLAAKWIGPFPVL